MRARRTPAGQTAWAVAAALVLWWAGAAWAGALLISGAGATFPAPLYSKWFAEYGKLHPEVRFNYASIGSGGGIKQLTERTVDFGATDVPMTPEEERRAPGVLHLPTALGAVAVVYSGGAPDGLRLTPAALADIFLGKITRWRDPRLGADNPGVDLPDLPITVAHRSDGSGTTAVFTDYLAKVAPEWRARVGVGKSVRWPVGLGGKGNEGVTGLVKSARGAIGYVELAYASQNRLPTAALRNAAGAFVKPSVPSTTAAAGALAAAAPPDGDGDGGLRASLTDAADPRAYPIAAATYLLVYREQADEAKGRALARLLLWALSQGQGLAPALSYAPLPEAVARRAAVLVRSMTHHGRKLVD